MVKRALVVGCNYPGSPHQLNGCGNDASNVCSLLCEVFEYRRQDIVMMVDTDPQTTLPTGANVKVHQLKLLSQPLTTCNTLKLAAEFSPASHFDRDKMGSDKLRCSAGRTTQGCRPHCSR